MLSIYPFCVVSGNPQETGRQRGGGKSKVFEDVQVNVSDGPCK